MVEIGIEVMARLQSARAVKRYVEDQAASS